MRRTATVVLLASVLAACSAAPHTSTPASGEPSVRTPSASPSPVAPATPPATAAPSTAAPSAMAFDWDEAVALTGLEEFDLYRPHFVHGRDTYVLANQTGIWFSSDALTWDVAVTPVAGNEAIEIKDLAAGAAGFVAIGEESIDADDDGSPEDSRAVVLTSSDGRRWERLADQRFEHASMELVAMSQKGMIAFGSSRSGGESIWTSVDGRDWLKATNETGLQVAEGVRLIAESNGRLLAFVSLPGSTPDESGMIEVWQTEGRAEWQRVGALPDSVNAHVFHAAHGGGRWLVLGNGGTGSGDYQGRAWTSADGASWSETTYPADAGINDVAGWTDGLIAAGSTGSEPGETCGGNEPYVGRTWLSVDGTAWQALPPTDGAAILASVVVDDRIVAIGQLAEPDTGGAHPVLWTAVLPTTAVAHAEPTPTPTPTPAPTGEGGCGG